MEAALTLGFTRKRAFFLVVLPQAARHFLPVFQGEFISLVKMTSRVGNRLQLCAEELIMEFLSGAYGPGEDDISIQLDISYSEADSTTGISISSGGKAFDLFNNAEKDDEGVHLGITMVSHLAKTFKWTYQDGKNLVEVII